MIQRGDGMKRIIKLEPATAPMPALVKVAAYARVSMECERLQHSLSAQVSYYSELIQKHKGWQYAGVYADNGISGTGTAKRDEFNRMLQDCESEKIDVILTKSISRFARNTVDLLRTVRHLKELGISVRFEKENIDSLSEDGELMLTLLGSFAQEESRSISDNVKWGTVKRFQQGIPNGQFRIFGYEWVNDRLAIIPEEAEIIRSMFKDYLNGASRIEIGRALNSKGIFTRQGNKWVDSNVKAILRNITYTGNMLFQKEFTTDPITKHHKINRGELPQFFVEDTHDAIIPMDEFQSVQAEFKRRRDLGPLGNKSLHLTAFSTKVTCSICGKHYRRSGKRNTTGDVYYIWTCQTKDQKGVAACSSKNIPEKMLQRAAAQVMGLEEFDSAVFGEQIEEVLVVSDDTLCFRFYDGHEATTTWQSTARVDCWTPERRESWGAYRRHKSTNPNRSMFNEFSGFITCGSCGHTYHCQSSTRSDGSRTRNWYCSGPRSACSNPALNDEVMRGLVCDVLGLKELDESIMNAQLKSASVLGYTVTFHFRDGHTTMCPWSKPKKYVTRRTDTHKNASDKERD